MQIPLGPASSVGFRDWGPGAWRGVKPTVKSSLKNSPTVNDNIVTRTYQTWQPRLGRNLSREDARQITVNAIGFFSVLAEWSRAERPSPANDTGKAVVSDDEGA